MLNEGKWEIKLQRVKDYTNVSSSASSPGYKYRWRASIHGLQGIINGEPIFPEFTHNEIVDYGDTPQEAFQNLCEFLGKQGREKEVPDKLENGGIIKFNKILDELDEIVEVIRVKELNRELILAAECLANGSIFRITPNIHGIGSYRPELDTWQEQIVKLDMEEVRKKLEKNAEDWRNDPTRNPHLTIATTAARPPWSIKTWGSLYITCPDNHAIPIGTLIYFNLDESIKCPICEKERKDRIKELKKEINEFNERQYMYLFNHIKDLNELRNELEYLEAAN